MTKADVIARIAIALDVHPEEVRELAWPLIVEFVAEWLEANDAGFPVLATAWREDMGGS